ESSSDQFTFEIGNSLWLDQSFAFNPHYQHIAKQELGATVKAIDFSAAGAADEINDWIRNRTAGHITGLIQPPLAPPLVIANAVYLKARWRNPFQQQASRPEAFHLGDGGTRQVTMMHNRASFAYQETEKWQSVALPYSGSEFVLWLILPKNGVS